VSGIVSEKAGSSELVFFSSPPQSDLPPGNRTN